VRWEPMALHAYIHTKIYNAQHSQAYVARIINSYTLLYLYILLLL